MNKNFLTATILTISLAYGTAFAGPITGNVLCKNQAEQPAPGEPPYLGITRITVDQNQSLMIWFMNPDQNLINSRGFAKALLDSAQSTASQNVYSLPENYFVKYEASLESYSKAVVLVDENGTITNVTLSGPASSSVYECTK